MKITDHHFICWMRPTVPECCTVDRPNADNLFSYVLEILLLFPAEVVCRFEAWKQWQPSWILLCDNVISQLHPFFFFVFCISRFQGWEKLNQVRRCDKSHPRSNKLESKNESMINKTNIICYAKLWLWQKLTLPSCYLCLFFSLRDKFVNL